VGSWKDENELTAKAQALRERLGIRALLVTRGAEGMTLYEAGRTRHEPAREEHEVIDVSGAGDTVIATLGVMLGVGMPLEEAVRVSNVAAGIKVLKFGTAVVQPKELRDALAQG
jgi:bifunctional ADP-heptose synthase (sugar kinase/adenylyltransferase)